MMRPIPFSRQPTEAISWRDAPILSVRATSDFYLVKTNSQGDTLWTRTYGGSGDDGPIPFSRPPTEAISWRDTPGLSVRATMISIL